MSYTEQLLKLPVSTLLKGCCLGRDGKPLSKGDLIKEVAREAYNCTRKAIVVESDAELINAIKIGLSCRAGGNSNETIKDLVENAHIAFKEKVMKILKLSAESMGSYVPKFSNPNISDAPVFFDAPKKLESGVNSASCDLAITGSGNGANVTGYSFLSSTYVFNGVEKSIFNLINEKNKIVMNLIDELAGDQISDKIYNATVVSVEREMSSTVNQFYKQSVVEFDGELIACTPLLSASMAVGMKRSIDDVFADGGRVPYTRFAVGGTNSQNVAALNADLGGGTSRVTAWIPRAASRTSIFTTIAQLNKFILDQSIRNECATLASTLMKIENKGSSNVYDRTKIDRIFSRAASAFLYKVQELCSDLHELDEEKRAKSVSSVDGKWIDYIEASTKRSVSECSVNIAFDIAASVKREISRNALSVHIEDSAIDAMCKILENKGKLCL
ncbi:hypothetical protein [Photobacterium damselae]|uniref:hypothetical protein n=1 Tax=Photobacterium damselae TaxID=38293 RepID=UPI004067E062